MALDTFTTSPSASSEPSLSKTLWPIVKHYGQRLQDQARRRLPPLFWVGLAVKVLLSVLFGSDYLVRLFIPFLDYWVTNWADPYTAFSQTGGADLYFPYPALLLYIMTPVAWLAHQLEAGAGPIHLLLYRLPLLAADYFILLVLLRWLRDHTQKVLLLYWLNPVLIYISYVHGQLDAIPIALVLGALYELSKNHLRGAAILLGAALACKANILAIVPFFLYYAFANRFTVRQQVTAFVLIAGTFLVLNLPFLSNSDFLIAVFQNPQAAKVYDLRYKFPGEVIFYFTPAVYILLVLHAFTFGSFGRDIMLMFLAFTFGILTLLVPPMQGWYFWLLPFLVYYFVKQQDAPQYVYWTLHGAYFGYFLLLPKSDIWQVWQVTSPVIAGWETPYHWLAARGVNTTQLHGLAFTLLQTSLVVNVAWVYRRGVLQDMRHKIKSQPYLVGVGGDSGAGKSTFTFMLQEAFGERNTAIVRGDDMHRWERGDANWQEVTHLNPRANRLHTDLNHAQNLKAGRVINRRAYDHGAGKFTLPRRIRANRLVVFEGLHPFYLERMRRLYDFCVFIRPDPNLRLHWKIVRDKKKRGYTREMVLEQLERRREDSERYIMAQAKHAHMIISFMPVEPITDPGTGEDSPALYLSLSVLNHVDPEPLLQALEELTTLQVTHQYTNEDWQQFDFYGEVTAQQIGQLGIRLVPEMEDIFPGVSNWHGGFDGLMQVFTCYCIFQQMKLEHP